MGNNRSDAVIEWVEDSLDKIIETAAIAPEKVLEEAETRGLAVTGVDLPGRLKSLRENDLSALDAMARGYIRTYTRTAAAQGFMTGIGGVITLPVTVPTDVAAFLVLVARANSAVMQTYGFDSQTEEGATMLRLGLAAGLGVNKLSVAGSTVLVKGLTKQVMTKPYREAVVLSTVKAVAKKVGVTLYKRHFAKVVPLIGGGINAGVSGGLVYAFGRKAMSHYHEVAQDAAGGVIIVS